MAFDYFCCFHSYREKIAKLSDQEAGRLFRALMFYSETGEVPELAGQEGIAFDFIAYDIDAAKERYAEKCAKNRENARKAAEAQTRDCAQPQAETDRCVPPQAPESEYPPPQVSESEYPPQAADSGRERTQAAAGDRERTRPKQETKNKKPKQETKNDSPPQPPAALMQGFSPELTNAISEWLSYKREKHDEYKPTGLKNLARQLRKHVDLYGDGAVADLISICMASNWRGIAWRELRKRPKGALESSGDDSTAWEYV